MPRESTVPWTQAPTLGIVKLGAFYSGLWILVPSEPLSIPERVFL
jgi:hypothetical protein